MLADAGCLGFVGMTGFGASGPAEVLYRYFGITPEAIVAKARSLLATQQRPPQHEPSHRLPRPRDDRAANPRAAAVVRARADRARRDVGRPGGRAPGRRVGRHP